jgi:hypothetical protein
LQADFSSRILECPDSGDDVTAPLSGASMTENTPLRRDEAAAYIRDRYRLPCADKYLAKLAVTGGGPKFRKASRWPIYDRADLDEWAQSRISVKVSSTSELREAA